MPHLVLAVLLTITGNVITRDGAAVAHAHVTATRPGGGVLARTVTDADGAFKLEHVDGVVDLETRADGFVATQTTVLADERPMTLVMRAGSVVAARVKEQARDELPPNVHGTVRDEANRPIAGVRVFLNGPSPCAITDARGQFAVTIRGEPTAIVSAGINASTSIVTLHAGESAEVVVERLPAIDGVLRDHDGSPVAGASVVFDNDRPVGNESRSAVTDSAGRFHLFTNPDAAGQLTARKAALPALVSKQLKASKKGIHGLVLTMPRGIDVRGVVTDMDGHGVGGVAIDPTVQPAASYKHWATTASDGSFKVRMNEGAAELSFAKERYLGTALPVEVSSSMRALAVRLQPIVYVRGTLVRKDGSPASDRLITSEEMIGFDVVSKADGTFEVPFAKAGSYTISTGLLNHDTNVRAPADGLRLLFDEGLSFRCRVIDEASGAPVTNAAVSVSGQDAAAAESDDEPGNYLFAGLSREPAAIDVTATGYLPARVSARAGQQEPLTIALKRGHTLRGRIHDENGQPLDRAAISRENDVKAFSDTDGTFELIGLELEEMRIGVSRPGSIGRTIAIAPNQLDGPPLDIELSSGLHVKGRVVAGDGQPVAVRVVAQSAELGAGFVYTSSDAAGRFEITGLAPARYDFTAGNEMTAAYGVVRDVDVEHVREIVLPVTTSETGTVTGRVTGLSPEYVSGTVGAAGYDGEARSLTSDDGTFRLEGVAAGKQTVSALVTNAVGQQRLASVSVDVPAGGETHVEIAFGPQRLVHGRVTRAGTPLSWASISFRGDEQSAIARTDVDGRYEVRLEPVRYAVTVREGGPETFHLTDLPYRGEVDAQQTAFDIAIEEAEVRVHVIDTQTGEPVVEARVQNVDEQVEPFLSPLTGADGIATLQIASGKPAALRIEKEGYGPVFVETAGGDVAVRLAKAAKLVVHVVDARDGRTLVAVVTAFDAKDHVVTHISQPGSDGLATFNLAPGEYHFTAAFDGFEIGTARVAVPSSGEVRIALRRKAG